jgi:hypothetical protein
MLVAPAAEPSYKSVGVHYASLIFFESYLAVHQSLLVGAGGQVELTLPQDPLSAGTSSVQPVLGLGMIFVGGAADVEPRIDNDPLRETIGLGKFVDRGNYSK